MNQPQYAPQFPPGYGQQPQQFQPPAPAYPQQGYVQQPQQFPAQPYGMGPGYPAPQMAPPAPQLAQGSIDDFFNQPSTGGGKSLAFDQIGTRYIGVVTRPLGSGDIQQQTDTMGKPLTFRDGRPKFVMKVPLQMQPSQNHPDGLGTWYCKGAARDELVRAMAEAGAPAGAPEAGAIIDITFTGTRASGAGMNPAKLFQVAYRRPEGAAQVPPAPAQQQPAPAQPDPQLSAFAQAAQPELAALQAQQQAQFAAAGAPAQPFAQAPSQPPAQQFVQPQLPMAPPGGQPQYQQPAQPPAQLQQPQQMPPGLDADQQALLARLTGAQQ